MATKKKKDLPERATPEQIGELKEKLMTTPITQEAAYAITEVLQEALPESKRSEALRVSLPLKEIILFYLWGYSTQTKDNGVKAQILEAHDVLKEGLVSIRVKNIDKEKGTFGLRVSPKANYSRELIDQQVDTLWVKLAIADLYGFKKEFLEATKPKEKPQHIKTGIHLASQFLGAVDPHPQTRLNFAEKLDRFTQETGLTMGNKPLGWGLDLNVAQQRVTHAILEAFSRDEYQGQITLPKEEVLTDPERGPNYLPAKVRSMGPEAMARKAYKHIPELPTIRLTLAEVVQLARYDHSRQGDKEKVKQAVAQLGTDRYLFYWRRKAFKIVNGVSVPERDSKGEHKGEEVIEDGSLFRVKHVLDEQTKELKYFEISPSAVVLDQVNPAYGGNYFLMVPRDLHVEIQKAVGKGKRSSSYTFAFIMYLLHEYERHRRHAKKGTVPEVHIAKPWEEIAQRIKMGEKIWKRNRQTAIANLERVYQVAKELGYLRAYSRGEDGVDTLELDPRKYFRPAGEPQEEKPQLLPGKDLAGEETS
jgi:hypothetical protein